MTCNGPTIHSRKGSSPAHNPHADTTKPSRLRWCSVPAREFSMATTRLPVDFLLTAASSAGGDGRSPTKPCCLQCNVRDSAGCSGSTCIRRGRDDHVDQAQDHAHRRKARVVAPRWTIASLCGGSDDDSSGDSTRKSASSDQTTEVQKTTEGSAMRQAMDASSPVPAAVVKASKRRKHKRMPDCEAPDCTNLAVSRRKCVRHGVSGFH